MWKVGKIKSTDMSEVGEKGNENLKMCRTNPFFPISLYMVGVES